MNALYNISAVAMMNGNFDWPAADLMVIAWAAPQDYVAGDNTIGDIKARGGVELGSSLPINGQTVALDGTGQTDTVVIPGITPGAMVSWLTLCIRETVHDASRLILYIDEVVGLPYDPNGLDMIIQPDWVQQRGWFRP